MNKTEKETTIHVYFNMWLHQDFSDLSKIFSTDIYYSECYGPEYYGLREIRLWIDEMLQKQTVLEWRIERFLHENDTVVVEWFFKEKNMQNNTIHSFNGISIIEFLYDGKISSIKEFESKAEHIAPYH